MLYRITKNRTSFLAGRWPLDKKMPTLFFIHGAGQHSIFWEAQLVGLLKVANTIALDLPGHGYSMKNGCSKIEDYGKSVIDLLNIINSTSPMICGLSMGGAITQYLLITEPNLFKSAILINTGSRLRVLPNIINTIESDYDKYIESFIEISTAKINRTKKIIDKILRCSDSTSKVTANDFRACNNFDVMKTVKFITTPTLVLTADEDTLTPVKYGLYLTQQITQSSYINIVGAGHMSPIEQPAAVNDAIINFLN